MLPVVGSLSHVFSASIWHGVANQDRLPDRLRYVGAVRGVNRATLSLLAVDYLMRVFMELTGTHPAKRPDKAVQGILLNAGLG